jgi:hypothetical protein
MDTPQIFKTKTGYCHILQDKIVLTSDGIIGEVANVTTGNKIARLFIIYGFISIGLLYTAFQNFSKGRNIVALFFIVLAGLLIFTILKTLNNTTTPIIERNKIKKVEFKKSIFGMTRSYFVIHFEDDKGKIKQRLILLPGSLNNGQAEIDKALQIMTREFPTLKNRS